MEEKRIVDYFAICGVQDGKRSFYVPEKVPDPITDICVINRTDNEPVPDGYECVETTPTGYSADLNYGSKFSSSMFVCIRRGRNRPPLSSIDVYFEGSDTLDPYTTVIRHTPSGFDGNVNNSGSKTFLTFKKSKHIEPCNQFVVSDLCIILGDKQEVPPHAYNKINKNLNKGIFGSSVYLCYKKTHYRPPYLRYDPVIQDRFPLDDYDHFSVPEYLPHFCLPSGAVIECYSSNVVHPSPKTLSFVLTSGSGDKLYVSSTSFHELVSPLELHSDELEYFGVKAEDENLNKKFFRSKAIAFLSHYPFFEQFKDFGNFLVDTFVYPKNPSSQKASLEAYIYSFMEDIPFPSSDVPNILVNLDTDSSLDPPLSRALTFTQTLDDLPIFSTGASFEKMLLNLDVENCLFVLLFALTEQKILLHSLRPGLLAEVAEAITTIIFPFNWHCPYIPLCPMNLFQMLHAPLPFIIGIDSGYFNNSEPPDDIASIDLDTRAIYLSEKKQFLNLNIFPKKELKQLRMKLEELHKKVLNRPKNMAEDVWRKKLRKIELQFQEAFLFFMAGLLKDFKKFLKPITAVPKVGATDPTSLFDMKGFLSSRDPSTFPFYESFLKTQMFTKFIEERCLVSDKNFCLAFFDECVDKVERYERGLLKTLPTLIEVDEQHKSNKTNIISIEDILPRHSGVQREPLPGISTLDHKLFFVFQDKHVSTRKSFHSVGSSSGRDSIDSINALTDLQIYPLAKRAKYEIKKAARIAQKVKGCPVEWSKHLLLTSYGLWFTHFPAFSHLLRESGVDSLSLAYQVLKRMHSMHFSSSEEFCTRVLMILCGVYNRPALAVKVLLDTKKNGVSMNAITYGYYNKAVLEGNWPSGNRRTARWALLKNTWNVVSLLAPHMKKSDKQPQTILEEPEVEDTEKKPEDNEADNEEDEDNKPKPEPEPEVGGSFSIQTIKDDQIKGFIVEPETDSSKAETNSIKSEDSFNDNFSTRFTTPIKAFTNMELFSNKSKVGSTLRSSFRFAKTKFSASNTPSEKKEDFSTPIKMSVSQTFDNGQSTPQSQNGGLVFESNAPASVGTTPSAEKSFISGQNISNSPWTAKHSEYLYSGFKSAANILKVQFQSNTSSTQSPVKTQFMSSSNYWLTQLRNLTNEKEEGFISGAGDRISDSDFPLSDPKQVLTNLGNYRELFDSASMFYLSPMLDLPEEEPEVALSISMITCTVCSKCQRIVYDEEIMSRWLPEDSNLNTGCPNRDCDAKFVPTFTIFLDDYRQSDGTVDPTKGARLDPISVPYISPLVLRKELTGILNSEGYSCLLAAKFVQNHPIVYWNLLWYFNRINLPSHIAELALGADSGLNPAVTSSKSTKFSHLNVKIHCLWDHESFYNQSPTTTPRHRKWLQMKKDRDKYQGDEMFEESRQLLEKIREHDLTTAIRFLISKRAVSIDATNAAGDGPVTSSIYRDLLFLTALELDMPTDVFDKLYHEAYAGELNEKERESLRPADSPPDVWTIFTRNLFKQLTLR